jgi:hypothetical protein
MLQAQMKRTDGTFTFDAMVLPPTLPTFRSTAAVDLTSPGPGTPAAQPSPTHKAASLLR